MSELSNESWMAFLFFIVLCFWGLAIFLFGRISVKHIEQEMEKEGIAPPSWDKGIGTKIAVYARVIIFPNLKRHASLVDVEATKRYARRKDFFLAAFLESSFFSLVIISGIIYYIYISEG
jgi:hypothetical protein